MKGKQLRPGFELASPSPFQSTVHYTSTTSIIYIYIYIKPNIKYPDHLHLKNLKRPLLKSSCVSHDRSSDRHRILILEIWTDQIQIINILKSVVWLETQKNFLNISTPKNQLFSFPFFFIQKVIIFGPFQNTSFFFLISLLLSRCTWTLTKRLKKKLDGNYTRMLRVILNKSWRPHPTRQQLYGQLPPLTKTIQVRRTRHAGHRWRSKEDIIIDVLLWTPAYGQAKAGRPARTYIQQLCEDTGCSPEDLPEAMNDREKWQERVWYIRASGTTWWWW